MSNLVAGVDSSTQSCKVVVCDAETGEVVRTARAPHPDGTEVDPRHWWEAWTQATADGVLDDVAAVSVGGQQHGMVTLDDHDEVVRPALLWNDTRSAQAAADLIEELGGREEWARATGVVPVAAITITKLRWLAEHEPESLERTRTCVLPHDWLTGRILAEGGAFERWATDRGDASGTGYWSPHTESYVPELLEKAIGRRLEVPEVLGPGATAGTTADGLVVGPGTGDNMGAALGLGIEPGDVVVSLGTSGTAFAVHSAPTADPSGEVAAFADATGRFLPLVCTLNAARVLTAGAALAGTDLTGLDELALAAEPGAQGLTLLPYLDAERTPNLPDATGTLTGLTRANATPGNLARACVEGMLLNLVGCLDSLRREGVPAERVLLIGGAAASKSVQAIAPELLGLPVAIPRAGEYVGLGAARQAAAALTGSIPDWSGPEIAETLEPSGGAWADDSRERYRAALQTMHGVTQG